jgi:hypothetical protein
MTQALNLFSLSLDGRVAAKPNMKSVIVDCWSLTKALVLIVLIISHELASAAMLNIIGSES